MQGKECERWEPPSTHANERSIIRRARRLAEAAGRTSSFNKSTEVQPNLLASLDPGNDFLADSNSKELPRKPGRPKGAKDNHPRKRKSSWSTCESPPFHEEFRKTPTTELIKSFRETKNLPESLSDDSHAEFFSNSYLASEDKAIFPELALQKNDERPSCLKHVAQMSIDKKSNHKAACDDGCDPSLKQLYRTQGAVQATNELSAKKPNSGIELMHSIDSFTSESMDSFSSVSEISTNQHQPELCPPSSTFVTGVLRKPYQPHLRPSSTSNFDLNRAPAKNSSTGFDLDQQSQQAMPPQQSEATLAHYDQRSVEVPSAPAPSAREADPFHDDWRFW